MSESTKKVVVIVVVILALGLAIFSIARTIGSSQPRDAGPLGGGTPPTDLPGGKGKAGGE